jgi:hypothetical protein
MYVGNMVDTNYSVVGMIREPGPIPGQVIQGLPAWEDGDGADTT